MEKATGKARYYLDMLLSHQAFRIVLLIMVTLRSCQLINPLIGPGVKFTLLWAAAILIKDLFTKRLLFINRWRGLFILFLLLYGVTTLTQRQNNFARNVAMLFYMTTNLMVFYAYDMEKEPWEVKKEIQNLSHTFMYVTFGGNILTLLAFVLNIRFRFAYMDGDFERRCWLGFFGGRMWGFFTNPNAASNFAVLNIMLMMVCLTLAGNQLTKGRRRFYAANLIVQSLVFFLSNSRSSWICLAFFLLATPFLALLYRIPEKFKGKTGKELVKRAAAIALASIFIFSGAETFAKSVLPKLVIPTSYFSRLMAELPNSTMPEEGDMPELEEVPDDLSRDNFGAKLGGRYYLWRAGLGIVVNHPLLGVTAENIPAYAEKYNMWPEKVELEPDEEPYLPGVQDGLHNIIIQIAAASGLPALLLMGIMAVSFLIYLIRYFIYAFRRGKVRPVVVVMTALVLTMLVRTMTETGLIYGVYYMSVIFWSFVSYILYFIGQDTKDDLDFRGGKEPLLARLCGKLFQHGISKGSSALSGTRSEGENHG